MKHASLLTPCLVAVGALACALPAAAQDRIYRCGNEYTNQVKGRKDCQPVEGGNVTIVRGTMPAAPVAAPQASGGATGAARAPVARAPAAPRTNTPEQRARDADARTILEQELRRAEQRHAELMKEYNNGEPERQGNERNYLKYQERVGELKASIDRNQADIEGIKRELERFK